jgi:hypothetical protein
MLASELLNAFREDGRDGNGNGDSGGSVKKKSAVSSQQSAVESSPADQFGHCKNMVVHFARGLQEFGGKSDGE